MIWEKKHARDGGRDISVKGWEKTGHDIQNMYISKNMHFFMHKYKVKTK